uniref:Uncharacterized protein n=1 Tax=Anguilla anguilla TaxID=7936 RepID=A0A0E9RYV7_ANGAN
MHRPKSHHVFLLLDLQRKCFLKKFTNLIFIYFCHCLSGQRCISFANGRHCCSPNHR